MTPPPDPAQISQLCRALATIRLLAAGVILLTLLLGLAILANPHTLRRPLAFFPLAAPPSHPLPHPDSPAMQIPPLGITVQMDDLAPDEQSTRLAELKAAGFGWVRQRLNWQQIEPAPGAFTWRFADTFVDSATAHGLFPVLVLDGSPAWARADRDRENPLAPPADFADFARFAAAVADRYQGRVRFYQVWDEPNIAPHWGSRLIDPVGYARLLSATAPAIRAQDGDAQIILAALAPTTDRGHTAIDELTYLRRLYAANAADHFEILAVQPFGFGLPPDDPPRADVLNFRRAELVRAVMVAAGDAKTPVWAVRAGWNVRLFAPWGTVTPANQVRFAQESQALARAHWPWLATFAWAIDRPTANAAHPIWGFALSTPDGATTPVFAALAGSSHLLEKGTPVLPDSAGGDLLWRALLLGVGLLLVGWRAKSAAHLLPWHRWEAAYTAQPHWRITVLWTLLLITLYFATWPPLILACWLLAGLGFLVHPQLSLYLAVTLLPFHYFHKELALPTGILAVPPAYAALILGLPGLVRSVAASGRIKRAFTFSPIDGLALGWLAIGLLGITAGWPLSAYTQGMTETVLVPLLLYAAIRGVLSVTTSQVTAHRIMSAAALGGVLAAVVGLWAWFGGDVTLADGVRRLSAPTFSPNHTALYLERSLFLIPALALATRSRAKRGAWLIGGLLVLSALALTASRGAWLLGLPAGVALFLSMDARIFARLRKTLGRMVIWIALASGLGAIGLFALWGERLTNSSTVIGRLFLWRGSLSLWAAHVWLGIGPGRFTWRYPAYVTAQTANEPNLLHPHNLGLEMATTGGILGPIWLTTALFIGWRLVLRIRGRQCNQQGNGRQGNETPQRWLAIGLAAGLVAGLAHAQVDAFAALADLAAWNWLALGLLVGLAPVNKIKP